MTREEAYKQYRERYQHKKSGLFNSPGWKVIILICRLILFPVMLLVRIFKWTYYID